MACALTIAGSDSGGGAGIQADLKTFLARGVYGASVITALTAQNTRGVHGVLCTPPDFLRQQLDAVFSDLRVDAFKSGMLPNSESIHVLSDSLMKFKMQDIPYVLDPVMVATSGDSLLSSDSESDTVAVLKSRLIPLCTVLTPNLPEASALLGWEATSTNDARRAAIELCNLGAKHVVVKGGHGEGDSSVDVLYSRDTGEFEAFALPRLAQNGCTHGTGCTLAAAICAELAKKTPIRDAVQIAKKYVHEAIKTGVFPISRKDPFLGALNHSAGIQIQEH
mmetsp:Transcript_6501/g.11618  ORF Transcript_6501/g.11618 Transcript_6501/m.11618 type:complete len:279 (-) Transcript_6501:503-1339(-)